MPDPLQELIANACSPSRFEADAALNLEICDWINQKGGTYPRTAAMTLAQLAGSKDNNQAILALTLLDLCVKKCGYAFHLQMGTKEFLNMLVRRFPAQPPSFQPQQNQWNHFDFVPHDSSSPLPVLPRILYMIKEWKLALFDKSSYREDVKSIHDMYQLLHKKGYQFPKVHDSELVTMMALQSLQSPEELEEHDNTKLSAKLQEHIRRGTPSDLVSADRIMKYLTGHDQRFKPDYEQRFSEQLRGVRSKAIVLLELLESLKPGEKPDLPIQHLYQVTSGAHTKIRQLLESGKLSKHTDTLEKLDRQLTSVLQKWDDIQRGVYDTHYDILTVATPPRMTPAEPVSLIDLEDGEQTVQDMLAQPFEVAPRTPTADTPPSLFTSPSMAAADAPSDEPPILLLSKNGLAISVQKMAVRDGVYHMKALFSNHSLAAMENMVLQLAAPKSMQLSMSPISSAVVPATTENTVYQDFTLVNPTNQPLRLRFIATYHQFGVDMEQSGEYSAQ